MVKRYKVSLDDSASTRWNHVLVDNKIELQQAMKELNSLIPNNFVFMIVEWILALCVYLNIVYYAEEIKSIAKYTKLSLGRVVLLQLYYEMNAHCTSIITKSNRGMCLTRTMDWDLPVLKKLTIIVDFTRNDKVLFTACTWVGHVGVFTGMKKNKFAISLNYRRVYNSFGLNILNTVLYRWPTGFLIREVLTNSSSYFETIDMLKNASLISPCYFTIVGMSPGEGCIIEREYDHVFGTIEYSHSHNASKGYICKTNHDQFKKADAENIIYSFERERAVNEMMVNWNNVTNPNTLMNNMKGFPLINEETIYTCQMIPLEDYIEAKVNYDEVKPEFKF